MSLLSRSSPEVQCLFRDSENSRFLSLRSRFSAFLWRPKIPDSLPIKLALLPFLCPFLRHLIFLMASSLLNCFFNGHIPPDNSASLPLFLPFLWQNIVASSWLTCFLLPLPLLFACVSPSIRKCLLLPVISPSSYSLLSPRIFSPFRPRALLYGLPCRLPGHFSRHACDIKKG